ncbi:MAG: Hpt domain-containing protein, partial [Campylobacterales bacterium]
MNPLLEQFLIEARENLAFIEQNLQHLGSGDSELINAIFRAAHTMKGGSGIVGFEAIKSITHRAEDLLDMLRSGKIAFNERMVEVLFDAFDEVVDLVEAAEMSGDVVEADEAKVQAIIRAIDELMNKKEERPVWKLPFKLDREAAWLKGAPMSFLSAVTIDLPLSSGEITEENLNDERLYAILFDVAQDCMVYGNDPIYALSLLGEKLLGIDMAMGRDEAKAILSGFDDEEGLLLRSMIIGYARASWSEIEDALYNFIDDIVIAPLSLELLWPNEPSDANVELYRDMMEVVRDGVAHQDLQAVTESINHLLGLIEPQTATAVAAQRLLRLVEATQLRPIEAWQRHVGVHAVPTQPAPSTAEAACEPPREITESDRETIRVILKQQYEQLLESSDAALVARVAHICSLVASCGRLTPPPTTRQEMIAWIEQEMG